MLTYSLAVEYPVITNITQNLNVVSRKDELISCSASGKPKPTITWSFNGTQIGEIDSSKNEYIVTIDSIKKAGHYTCTATNKHSNDSQIFSISVQGSF